MRSHPRKPSRFNTRVNSLGLPSGGLARVLDALESSPRLGTRRRSFMRWPFRKESVELTLVRPGQGDTVLVVACRNISTMGVSLLHSSYIHPGTACTVVLPGARSGQRVLHGKVARCAHRTGMLHEVGVQFASPIDLRDFVPVAMQLKPSTLERVDPECLKGVLVYFSESREERALMREKFRSTALVLRSVSDMSSLVKQVALGCDAVLIDGPRETVKEVLKLIRNERGLVVGCFAATNVEARMLQLSIGGIAAVAVKPLAAEMLSRFVAELLHVKRVTTAENGTSNTWETLVLLKDAAEKAIEAHDRQRCVTVCEVLEVAARDAGFDDIAFAAARARGLLSRDGHVDQEQLAELMQPLTAQLRARAKWDAA